MLIWKFATKNFTVLMTCFYDNDYVVDFEDPELEEQFDNGDLAAYVFHAQVKDKSGNTLGESYLGGSVYNDPANFRDHVGINIKSRKDGRSYGSYFTQMISEAIEEARKTYATPRPFLREGR